MKKGRSSCDNFSAPSSSSSEQKAPIDAQDDLSTCSTVFSQINEERKRRVSSSRHCRDGDEGGKGVDSLIDREVKGEGGGADAWREPRDNFPCEESEKEAEDFVNLGMEGRESECLNQVRRCSFQSTDDKTFTFC